MPGFSASSASSASAGGQDEQPWLVNSSSTALASPGGAGSPTPARPRRARPAPRRRDGAGATEESASCRYNAGSGPKFPDKLPQQRSQLSELRLNFREQITSRVTTRRELHELASSGRVVGEVCAAR